MTQSSLDSERWSGKRVLLVSGGDGSERAVSIATGDAFERALNRAGVEHLRFDFRRERLAELVTIEADVALLAVHGLDGENGHLQSVFEMQGIPYTGAGVMSSAVAMDKVMSKRLFAEASVPTPSSRVIRSEGGDETPAIPMNVPFVVKPSLEGSSVGITIVHEPGQWPAAWALAVASRGQVLVEAFVAGRELSVGVRDGALMGIVEIRSTDGVYDYEAKYVRGDTNYLIPAPLSAEQSDAVGAVAIAAYDSLGCRGVARADILLDERGAVWVLEVNTVPGMTATSLVPKMAACGGQDFDAFVLSLLDDATLDVMEER
jgi:D-alanine-D-alanine ligase